MSDSITPVIGQRHRPAALGEDRTIASGLGWGLFLGMSWTWCIGMFLPVLLVRDFGLWGWVVFAVPNVVGAAAMGWVLRDAAASQRMVRDHASACVIFSIVTLAFHLYFIGWFLRLLPFDIVIVPIATAVAFAWIAEQRRGAWKASGAALIVSVAAIGVLAATRALGPLPSGKTSADVFPLALVCLLGFSTCPYLDLTFHQARQATSPRNGKLAFAFGFGIVFFAMIVASLFYARPLLSYSLTSWALIVLGLHILTQAGLKFVLHDRAIETLIHDGSFPDWFKYRRFPLSLAVGILPTLAAFQNRTYHGLTFGEIGYRLFLAFYGLVFPAYVWIYIVPPVPPTRRARIALLTAIVLSAPLYWLGFVEQRMIWLVPGVLVVLLSKLLAAWS